MKLIHNMFGINLPKILASLCLGIVLFFGTTDGDLATANAAPQLESKTDYSTSKQEAGLLYSDSQEVPSLNSVSDFVSSQEQQELLDPGAIPAPKQPIINRADPDNKLLEKTAQMFEDAGDF